MKARFTRIDARSCPVQGTAERRRGGGLLLIFRFTVLSVKYQFCHNPHRFAEPPVRGHEGGCRGRMDAARCRGSHYLL